MAKNQKKLQNSLMNLSKKSSILVIRAILILFPLSIISFLLSCNYEFCHSVLFNHYFPYSIKNSLGKNAVFCLFNVILLFLAKDFGLLVSSADYFPHPKGENQPPTPTLLPEEIAEQNKQVHVMVKPAVLMEEEQVVGEMKEEDIDELNRKFEEFIERVKRERQMEAAQQLILAA
ncbi:hypothetical protein KSP40_PGU022139 [Platanthera guangdongensis]|uniref:Transmembrane protein n=1 Tax=Platanthera guangdongensis TaxID=2320717 RepID=A0ABR2LDN7_9ASPA